MGNIFPFPSVFNFLLWLKNRLVYYLHIVICKEHCFFLLTFLTPAVLRFKPSALY